MTLLSELYRFHFKNEARERLFLASIGFLLTFGIVRVITLLIRMGVGPFHNVTTNGGLHIHHLVWGILILLLVGYVWLIEKAVGSSWVASITAIAYGVGAALTLDEFALWLNLQDVYWERAGRQSVDAVIIFASLLSVGIWGGPFLRAVAKEFIAAFRQRVRSR
ncbi:MAG TPA: hypothetical protein VG426_00840 [Candidatus Dormibacteraeota bacterium]|jgi:hypothetical protein|nr:hypothetical protein [Candidatus Dormibacteraeota bacterium]